MGLQKNGLVPEFWCSDFEVSFEFYTNVLGFSVVQRRGKDRHAYLELGAAQLMIARWEQDGTWEPAPLEKPYGRGVNFSIHVNDIKSQYDRIKAAGIEPFVDLYDVSYWRPDGMEDRKEFGVLDPDGYLLRFAQIVGHRPIEPGDLEALDNKP